MADGNRTTLAVAVAGITATALVGLAGTAASWLSARDDRASQRELARDERIYDRRVSAYLDAIDFVEAQKASFDNWLTLKCFKLECDRGKEIAVTLDAPRRLVSRLRAFGSARAFKAFQETQSLLYKVPFAFHEKRGIHYLTVPPYPQRCQRIPEGWHCYVRPNFKRPNDAWVAEVDRFETYVHEEVG